MENFQETMEREKIKKRLQSLNLMVEARVSKRLFVEVAKWNKYSQLNEK